MTSTDSKSKNLAQAHELIREACDKQADMIALPENFGLMTDDSRQILKEAETPKEGLLLESAIEWAVEYGVWILAGSIPIRSEKSPRKVFNTSFLINSDGKIVARYDKIHLFEAKIEGNPPYKESRTIQAGNKVVVARTPVAPLGLSICYDLRFPELYRQCVTRGAAILAVPSAFTQTTGKAHWDVLTRARAIENQSFLVAPAQWGGHPGGRATHGHTRIIDPWGRILAERPAGIGTVIATLDTAVIDRVRRELPALKSRTL